ncbi:hypothetical protein EON65_28905 [archaeon]|nr:MAG: hypothetical protein EON65_28905 [archaeon]
MNPFSNLLIHTPIHVIPSPRCVYDNIRKFLQFQLAVNLVALLLVFISAIAGFEVPLNAVQLLWVNLVMDTMGALALGMLWCMVYGLGVVMYRQCMVRLVYFCERHMVLMESLLCFLFIFRYGAPHSCSTSAQALQAPSQSD